MTDWLALVIGNTRWHWAWFDGAKLKQVWHTPHLTSLDPGVPKPTLRSILTDWAPPPLLNLPLESMGLWATTVVPSQTHHLQQIPTVRWIDQFFLEGCYPTMGLDRVITLAGAGYRYDWPVLIIDAGTALTFTAGAARKFLGGAILLGLRSHFTALHEYTAALPLAHPSLQLPPRWAKDTVSALQSGVIYTTLASVHQFIQDWQQQYPTTTVIFTGGDGEYLHQLYQQTYQTKQNQTLTERTWFDANLMFWGIFTYRRDVTRAL